MQHRILIALSAAGALFAAGQAAAAPSSAIQPASSPAASELCGPHGEKDEPPAPPNPSLLCGGPHGEKDEPPAPPNPS